MSIYSEILNSKTHNKKLLAILIDPDKLDMEVIPYIASKINTSRATHIFIGGSRVFSTDLDKIVAAFRKNTKLPLILFPGNPSQIATNADGILFLSLISGRNPDYLIGHQITAAPILKNTDLEIIPTGYILIESGNQTAVESVSGTEPMPVDKPEMILHTAQAGEMSGKKLIYLEAGSGAENLIPASIIEMVSNGIEIPLIVGGGIKNKVGIDSAYAAGADLVVIGTAFENDYTFFD